VIPRRPSPGLVLTAALIAAACGGDGRSGTETLSDSVYVDVMARLVVLDSALSPTPEAASVGRTRADSLRARVLESRGVEPDQLLEYARTRGTSPDRMEAVWRRVHELSDSLTDAGWTPPGGPSPGDAAGDSAGAAADSAAGGGGDVDGADDASGPGPAPPRGRP
jgi:hypothetical protein